MITDGEHPVALAGIMGGLDTEVDDATTDVLLEAANFEPTGIQASSERLGLRTEGSNRWEKGVDPHLAAQAATLATGLMVEYAGARWVGDADVHAELPARPVLRLRPERSDALIGLDVAPARQRDILTGLGFEVGDDWQVTVPTWRARDVYREVDLVEEIARFELDDVPFTLPVRRELFGRLTRDQRLRRRLEEVLVGAGFAEVYTPTLVPAASDPDALALPEPLSVEQAVLRTNLVHGLVEAVRRNLDAGNERIALFELARVYLPSGGQLPEERWHLAGVVEGGFSRAKGAVELLYDALGIELSVEPAQKPFLHPGKAAQLDAGVIGELHPLVLEGGWGFFELDAPTLGSARAGGAAVRRRDHLPGPEAGSRVRRRRGRARGRPRRGRARGGGARAARDARVRRLPRRAGGGRPQVGRVPRRVPVARADADRRGRRGAPGPDRRSARRALRRVAARVKPIPADRRIVWTMRLVATLAAAAALLLLPASSSADNQQLIGTVGPGFTISLKAADGSAVTHLDPGTYQLVVHDLSNEHDFHLFGPSGSGVDATTGPDLEFVGDKTFTLVLRTAIKVDFVCDAHAVMHGAFTVGTVAATPPPATRGQAPGDPERAAGGAEAGRQGARGERDVHRHPHRHEAVVEPVVPEADRPGDGGAHPPRPAGQGRARRGSALRPLHVGREGKRDAHGSAGEGGSRRRDVRERPHRQEPGRRDPRAAPEDVTAAL